MARQYYSLNQITFVEKPKHRTFVDLDDLKFERLKILGYAGIHNQSAHWYCACDCGKIIKTSGKRLRSGGTKSCGCLQVESVLKTFTKHGKKNSVEYRVYKDIKRRCNNENRDDYYLYGGRGIKLLLTFEEFFEEIGFRPSKKYSVDRIDTNGNYEKGNIRWSTAIVQGNNRRDNVFITVDGETKTISNWARLKQFSPNIIYNRINRSHWCGAHAVSLPLRSKKLKNCPDCNKQILGGRLPQSELR